MITTITLTHQKQVLTLNLDMDSVLRKSRKLKQDE